MEKYWERPPEHYYFPTLLDMEVAADEFVEAFCHDRPAEVKPIPRVPCYTVLIKDFYRIPMGVCCFC